MNRDFTVKREAEKVIELMSLILNIDQEIQLRVRKTIEEIGMETFLFNIHALDFPNEMKEKVNALEEIIQMNDIYGKAIYPVKGGDRDDK
jgi:hypothetical protein